MEDHIQPFVTLASSPQASNPRVVADIIRDATSSPKTFSFGELLYLEPVQALHNSGEYGVHLRILEIFAWGTYDDYLASSNTPPLPALSDAQIEKLRILTILSLAHNHPQPLPYSAVLTALHLSSDQIALLEALVTKAVYADLMTAQLSPTTTTGAGVGCIYITSVKPVRDVPLSSVPLMANVLSEARARCSRAIADVEAEVARVMDAAKARTVHEREKDAKLRRVYNDETFFLVEKGIITSTDKHTTAGLKRSLNSEEEGGRDRASVNVSTQEPAHGAR